MDRPRVASRTAFFLFVRSIDSIHAGYLVSLLLDIGLVATSSIALAAGNPIDKPGWTLVFNDEFDQPDIFNSINNSGGKWYSGYGWDGAQDHGNEQQYYTRYWKDFSTTCNKGGVNHLYSNGTLTLQARKEPGSYEALHFPSSGPAYSTCDPHTYTSGVIFSRAKFLYGYFEICCKIPNQGKVLWPAFWLWSGNALDGSYREIDVFEFGGWNTPWARGNFYGNVVGTNMHISQALDNGYIQDPNDAEHTNHYPFAYPLGVVHPTRPNVTDAFHTYAVRWSPNMVTWYVDNEEVYSLSHSPHLDMYIIANLAIANAAWWPSPSTANCPVYPYDFVIDYIRAYQSDAPEFVWKWGNGGSDKIDLWYLNGNDKYVTADFAGLGRDQLLAINAGTHYAHLMAYDQSSAQWSSPWFNSGSGKIDWWNINPNDQFIAADFDGDGRSELLGVNAGTRYAHLMKYNPATESWSTIWTNLGNGRIDLWNLNPGDRFVAGDFDGDGKAELLAINGATKYAHLMHYASSGWTSPWFNVGNGRIDQWYLNTNDAYVAGDFDGDGRSELLAINTTSKYAHLMRFSSGGWNTSWSNAGNGQVAWWIFRPGDQYRAADFRGDGRDQLFAVARDNGWAQLMSFESGNWTGVWGNDGAGRIDLWYMNQPDRYASGRFGEGKAALLLALSNPVSAPSWAHLLELKSTGYYAPEAMVLPTLFPIGAMSLVLLLLTAGAFALAWRPSFQGTASTRP